MRHELTSGFLDEVKKERERQWELWGATGQSHHPFVWTGIITKTFGKVGNYLVADYFYNDTPECHNYKEDAKKEMVQTAALLCAMWENLDTARNEEQGE